VSDFQAIVAIAAVRESGWSAAQRSVFAMLAMRASVDGDCWASAATIGADCGYDERTARRMMDALEACGAIIGRARRGQTTVWRLHPEAVPRVPRAADPGDPGHRIRGPRAQDPGTPGTGSGVAPGRAEGPRTADPATPDSRSEDPGSAVRDPGQPIRRSLQDPSSDPSSDPSTLLEGSGVQARTHRALTKALELQQARALSTGDVGPLLTKQDEQHIGRWAKATPPYGPGDFEIVWAYFASSDEFQPLRARAKGHFRWATLCNEKFPDRVRLARAWEARGRCDLDEDALARAPARSRAVDRSDALTEQLARYSTGQAVAFDEEPVVITVLRSELASGGGT